MMQNITVLILGCKKKKKIINEKFEKKKNVPIKNNVSGWAINSRQ